MQGAPDDLAERVDVLIPGQRGQRLAQFRESLPDWGRCRWLSEGDVGEGEHGFVKRRVRLREREVGPRQREQFGLRRGGCLPRGAHGGGKFGEPLNGDGLDDGVLALEMAVEHGLAVLDGLCQPPGGDRVPAFRLGELARGGDDPLVPPVSFPGPALLDRHW
jgi:hypothetical protein